jgi:TPR repeat protein
MYYQGTGVPEDYVLAYAWVSIAAAQGRADGKKAKAIIAKRMTPTQIAEAQKVSRELWEKYVVPFQKE